MAFPVNGIVDNFNRANEGPPPSASWTDLFNGLKVISNTLHGNVALDSNLSLYETVYGPDSECYLTIITEDNANGVFARCTTLSISTFDGYYVEYVEPGPTDTTIIYRIDNGTAIQLGATISQEFVSGDGLGIEVIGSTIKAYRRSGGTWSDISSGGRSDGTYSNAGHIGVNMVGTTAVTDDFGGGTIPSSATRKFQRASILGV